MADERGIFRFFVANPAESIRMCISIPLFDDQRDAGSLCSVPGSPRYIRGGMHMHGDSPDTPDDVAKIAEPVVGAWLYHPKASQMRWTFLFSRSTGVQMRWKLQETQGARYRTSVHAGFME